MRFVADLHIHSRFSRATSQGLTLASLHAWAQRKGIFVLGTGDITHPVWLEEIAEQLVPAEEGLFRLRPDLAAAAEAGVPSACRAEVRFVLQGEVSSIYKHDGAVRKVHNLVFCPTVEQARRFLGALDRLGNVRSDGRPILGLPSRVLLEVLLGCGPGARLVPAHIWTPWFSLLGSKSGYDSVEACFGDLAGEIAALETGLSSDPAMNWRVSALDRYALISNSDAHSAQNLGREANEFCLDPCYAALFESLSPGDPRFLGTLEFFPEHGKYHLDGHRKCGVRLIPGQTRELEGRCPSCGGGLTVGVLHRVEELADRPEGSKPQSARPFESLVPLAELVAECAGMGKSSQRIHGVCDRLLERLGPELFVLRAAPLDDIGRLAGPVVAEGIRRVREGRLRIEGGYDGEFGKVRIFSSDERRELERQAVLFEDSKRAGGEPEPAPPKAEMAATRRPVAGGPGRAARRAAVSPGLFEPTEGGALAGLNPEQREAVTAPAGPLLILAGPGTGKTRALTHRIARKVLNEGVPSGRVAALTFTNRAAEELQARLAELLDPAEARRVTVCTLHRLGLRILREEAEAAGLPADFQVIGEEESADLVRMQTGLSSREARQALEEISRSRRAGTASPEALAAASAYEAALDRSGRVDLDGLILGPVRLLERDPAARRRWAGRFTHLAVDEFQDLDPLQFRLISLIAPDDTTVIGDPDQSIYGFRGADPGLFGRFLEERPSARRIGLRRNYRSTPTILSAAAEVLAGGQDPAGKDLVAFLAEGPRLALAALPTERGEAEFVAREVERLVGGTSHLSLHRARGGGEGEGVSFADIAVLYRLRAQRTALEEALERAGFPLRIVGDEPAFLRRKGKELLRRLRGWSPSEDAREAVTSALAGSGIEAEEPAALAWRAAAAGAPDVAGLLTEVALRAPSDDYDPRAEAITLLTLHAAKGLEFTAVFLVGCEEGILPRLRDGEEEEALAEERRLLYVGMTRARRILYLTRAEQRVLYGQFSQQRPSRFLAHIEDALVEARKMPAPAKRDKEPRQLRLPGTEPGGRRDP